MAVVRVNDVDLYYEIHGSNKGFPLVLAHGYCTSINLWKHQIPPLAERYRVIAYDARGHGMSSAPAGKANLHAQSSGGRYACPAPASGD